MRVSFEKRRKKVVDWREVWRRVSQFTFTRMCEKNAVLFLLWADKSQSAAINVTRWKSGWKSRWFCVRLDFSGSCGPTSLTRWSFWRGSGETSRLSNLTRRYSRSEPTRTLHCYALCFLSQTYSGNWIASCLIAAVSPDDDNEIFICTRRYKPIIIASAVAALGLFSLMLWTTSIVWVYCFQLCYGFFMAAEVAYYTYIYAKVDKEHYQRVTGQTRASLLIGRFLGSVLAQFLYSFELMDVRQLNFISLGSEFQLIYRLHMGSTSFFTAQAVSLPIALFLPSVGISIYMWSYDSGSLANGTPLSVTSTEGTFSQDGSSIEKTSISSNLRPKFS